MLGSAISATSAAGPSVEAATIVSRQPPVRERDHGRVQRRGLRRARCDAFRPEHAQGDPRRATADN